MSDRLKPVSESPNKKQTARRAFLRAALGVSAATAIPLLDGAAIGINQFAAGVVKASELYTDRVATTAAAVICPDVPAPTPTEPDRRFQCPAPEEAANLTFVAGIALGGFLFENKGGNLDNRELQADSVLKAPVPNRTFLLTVFEDSNYMKPVLQRKLMVMPDGNGWGVNPESGQPYARDESTGLYYVEYRRTGPGAVRARAFNKLTESYQENMAVAPYEVRRLTSKGEVAVQDLGACGCKVEEIYRDSAALCIDGFGLDVDQFTLNRRLDLYPVKDWTEAKPGQLLRPDARFLKERKPVGL